MKMQKELFNEYGEVIGGTTGEPFNDYIPPSWDVYFMRQVYEVAAKSKDPSTKIGAVIVRDKHPILFGYNGIPPGVSDSPERMVRPDKYKWFEHGERNAIYCGARFGISTDQTVLYTQALPCSDCGRAIIAAGIIEVVLHRTANDIFRCGDHYNAVWKKDDEITKKMFEERGITLRWVEMFVGKPAYIAGRKYNI